jgi:hypothetical protein
MAEFSKEMERSHGHKKFPSFSTFLSLSLAHYMGETGPAKALATLKERKKIKI